MTPDTWLTAYSIGVPPPPIREERPVGKDAGRVLDVDEQALRQGLLPGVDLVEGAHLVGPHAGGVHDDGHSHRDANRHADSDRAAHFIGVAVRVGGRLDSSCVETHTRLWVATRMPIRARCAILTVRGRRAR